MIEKLKTILGIKPSANFKELFTNGAIIVDVRTKQEFNSGNIKNSINIPLDSIAKEAGKLDKNKVIITCCQSGIRSGMAKGILKSQGYTAHNGGSWLSLKNKIK
jgi:phage shock protein E